MLAPPMTMDEVPDWSSLLLTAEWAAPCQASVFCAMSSKDSLYLDRLSLDTEIVCLISALC